MNVDEKMEDKKNQYLNRNHKIQIIQNRVTATQTPHYTNMFAVFREASERT